MLELRTPRGVIALRLLHDLAPRSAALVVQLALEARCTACGFYRNEAVPPPGSSGPPYGLLQGGLGGVVRKPPRDEGLVLQQ